MLLSILSMFGGGLLRLLPELFAFMNKKADNDHELAMMDKQMELEKLRGANAMATAEVQTNAEQFIHMLDAQAEALKSQLQITGIKIVDALNFLVRPLTTYYFLALYGAAKVAMFAHVLDSGEKGVNALLQVYTPDDQNMLFGILGFWFLGRVLEKKGKQ